VKVDRSSVNHVQNVVFWFGLIIDGRAACSQNKPNDQQESGRGMQMMSLPEMPQQRGARPRQERLPEETGAMTRVA
jgi:hypothetical protein